MVEDTEPGEEETPGNVWLTQSEDGTGTAYNFEPEPCGSLLISWFQNSTRSLHAEIQLSLYTLCSSSDF